MIKKNKNETLIVILVLLIVFAFIYLVYRNYQYTQVLESFTNNSQGSLSTYYTNNIDSDDYGHGGENPNYIHDAYNNPSTLNLNIYDPNIQQTMKSINNNMQKNKNYNEKDYEKDQQLLLQSLMKEQYNKKFSNSYHTLVSTNQNQRDVGWSGVWEYKYNNDNIMRGSLYQINDKVIISLSQVVHKSSDPSNNNNFYPKQNSDDTSCPENLFLGVGQLSSNRTSFILTKIYCNSFPAPDGSNFIVNNMTGKLFLTKNDTDTYYSITGINKMSSYPTIVIFTTNQNSTNVLGNANIFSLARIKSYQIDSSSLPFKSDFIMNGTNFVNPSPVLLDNKYRYEEDHVCPPNSSKCMTKNYGTGDASWDQQGYNACASSVNPDNSCDDTTIQCLTFKPSGSNLSLPQCTPSNNIRVLEEINFNTPMQLTQNGGLNSAALKICGHLNYINNKEYDTTILCYIKNLGDVRTLSYEYYGINTQQNNLSTQYDMMNALLNSPTGLLTKYRTLISSGTLNKETLNALSFTNILESMDSKLSNGKFLNVDSINKVVNTAITQYNAMYGGQYTPRKTNSDSLPLLWKFGATTATASSMLNSCVAYLSTSDIYTSTVKNAEFSSDGTTSLSLYSGGMKQQLIFENARIIKDINTNDLAGTKYYAMTTNLRTNSQLYLIPSSEMNGFTNNASILKLQSYPEENGKWLIIGLKGPSRTVFRIPGSGATPGGTPGGTPGATTGATTGARAGATPGGTPDGTPTPPTPSPAPGATDAKPPIPPTANDTKHLANTIKNMLTSLSNSYSDSSSSSSGINTTL